MTIIICILYLLTWWWFWMDGWHDHCQFYLWWWWHKKSHTSQKLHNIELISTKHINLVLSRKRKRKLKNLHLSNNCFSGRTTNESFTSAMYKYDLSSANTGWTKVMWKSGKQYTYRIMGHSTVYLNDTRSLVVFGGYSLASARYSSHLSSIMSYPNQSYHIVSYPMSYPCHPNISCTFLSISSHLILARPDTPCSSWNPVLYPALSHVQAHPILSHPFLCKPILSTFIIIVNCWLTEVR